MGETDKSNDHLGYNCLDFYLRYTLKIKVQKNGQKTLMNLQNVYRSRQLIKEFTNIF